MEGLSVAGTESMILVQLRGPKKWRIFLGEDVFCVFLVVYIRNGQDILPFLLFGQGDPVYTLEKKLGRGKLTYNFCTHFMSIKYSTGPTLYVCCSITF